MSNYITTTDVAANDVLTATYLNRIVEDFLVIGKHDHSPSTGEGNRIVVSASGASTFVERQYFFMNGRPGTAVALEIFSRSGGQLPDIQSASNMFGGVVWGFQISRPTALNDWYGFQCPLIKGIYQLQMMYLDAPNGGAASIELGTSGLGLVDTYSSVSSGSVLVRTFSNIQVTSTASYLLTVIQTSSNTLSSSNITKLGGWALVKTSNG